MQAKNRLYIIISLFAIGALGVAGLGIYPNFESIQDISSQIWSNREQVDLLNMQHADVAAFQEKYPSYKDNLEKIDKLFVNPSDPVGLIQFMESVAEKNTLTANISIVHGQDEKQELSGIMQFQIAVRGNMQNILNFSREIEHGSYLIRIQKIIVDRAEQTDAAGHVIATNAFDGNFYIQVVSR